MTTVKLVLALLLFIPCSGVRAMMLRMEERTGNASEEDVRKWDIHLSYVAGQERLDNGWSPAQHQAEMGIIDFDFGRRSWPVSICAQFLFSYSPIMPRIEGLPGEWSGTGELNLGVRKIFQPWENLQPHVSAGVGLFGMGTSEKIDDFGYYQYTARMSPGVWGEAGVFWRFSDPYFTGASVEYSRASVNFFGHHIEVGGLQVLFCFGYSW